MKDLERALREAPVPDQDAEARAWRLVQAAYARRPSPRRGGSTSRRGAQVVVLSSLAIAVAAALTPAGASVVALVRHSSPKAPAVTPRPPARIGVLPSGGRLLAVDRGWATLLTGSAPPRRLAAADEATFSAFGHYVAVARRRQLTVFAIDGRRVWSLTEPQRVSALRWSPDGLRIAYRAGRVLRVVSGNGEDPQTVGRVADGALAWRPGPQPVLAYLRTRDLVAMIDVGTRAEIARLRPPPQTTTLTWSTDGARLVALGPHAIRLFNRAGRLLHRTEASPGSTFVSAAFNPGRHQLALLNRGRDGDTVTVGALTVDAGPRLGPPVWSPDGRWLLITHRKGWDLISRGTLGRQAPVRISHAPLKTATVSAWCCSPRP